MLFSLEHKVYHACLEEVKKEFLNGLQMGDFFPFQMSTIWVSLCALLIMDGLSQYTKIDLK